MLHLFIPSQHCELVENESGELNKIFLLSSSSRGNYFIKERAPGLLKAQRWFPSEKRLLLLILLSPLGGGTEPLCPLALPRATRCFVLYGTDGKQAARPPAKPELSTVITAHCHAAWEHLAQLCNSQLCTVH